MFKLDSEKALLDTFRPKDRAQVELGWEVKLPLFVRDYLAWTHPAGGRVFLVFAVAGGVPTGIVFETNGGGAEGAPAMCDWCHCTGKGTEVGLLTARLNAHKRVGAHVCVDLACQRKVEEECNRAGKSVRPAMAKLVERMGRFASGALQIDLSGGR